MDSSQWDARYAAAPDLVWTADPNRFVVEVLTDLPPGRALDLAAGEGRNAVWLAQQGWQVTAVEFSTVAVERGRRLADQRGVTVEWIVADLRAYAPPTDSFDAVIVAYLHLPAADLSPVLTAAGAALAPGGTLLIVGHDVANLTAGVGGPQDAALLHTPEAIVAPLDGLDVTRAATVRRPVRVGDETRHALDTVVVAVRP
ncbi:class I SAM-dependent methyltransferase [Micromonospora sp. NPDC049679]|uniref:class I SAM-dependent methyltransferase n=1 Tax=Micromonospora sp. NPDC049679 TaxID=3155920 RepID=UPI0033E0301D